VHYGERKHAWVLSKRDPLRWFEVELQTFFTVPGNAVHYFCVTVPGSGAEDGHVTDGRGRSQCLLIDDIKD
jgi:hypothetical protein